GTALGDEEVQEVAREQVRVRGVAPVDRTVLEALSVAPGDPDLTRRREPGRAVERVVLLPDRPGDEPVRIDPHAVVLQPEIRAKRRAADRGGPVLALHRRRHDTARDAALGLREAGHRADAE